MQLVERRPWMSPQLLIGAALVIALVCGSVGYGIAVWRSDLLVLEDQQLRQSEAQLQSQVVELETQVADWRVRSQVGEDASSQLQASLRGMQDELATLREEVTFYRSLMAPSSLERGLQIARFALLEEEAPRSFRYELLLTQVETRRGVVQGRAQVDVVGRLEGVDGEVVLALTELTELEDYPLVYRFRYFQDFAGKLTIPEGFRPESVLVTVNGEGGESANLQRAFEWSVTEI